MTYKNTYNTGKKAEISGLDHCELVFDRRAEKL